MGDQWPGMLRSVQAIDLVHVGVLNQAHEGGAKFPSLSLSPLFGPMLHAQQEEPTSLMYQAYASFHGQTMPSRLVFHALHIASFAQA